MLTVIIDDNKTGKAIELFACCCEQMNNFARSLREQIGFGDVRTYSDIRQYDTGWRLEKYVEAEIVPNSDQVAAWCIELGRVNDKWIVSSSVNVSHSNIYTDLGNRFASSEEQLRDVLAEVFDTIEMTIDAKSEFFRAIEQLRRLK